MPKKILNTAMWTALVAFLFAVISILLMQNKFPAQSMGEVLFAKTYDLGTDVNRIKISSKENNVTLVQKDGYWAVEEADNYFSRLELINSLLLALNNTTFYTKIDFSEELLKDAKLDEKGVLITTFVDDEPIDEVIIGRATQNSEYTFVRKKNIEEIWIADGQFLLPMEFYSWVMQPIIDLPVDIIEEITDGTKVISRNKIGENFRHKDNQIASPQAILNVASKIFVEGVMRDDNFEIDNYPNQRVITFTLFPGLIIEYHLFYNASEYWLKINLDKTPLPKTVVNAYIKDNKAFYEGWYFKLPERIGKALSLSPLR